MQLKPNNSNNLNYKWTLEDLKVIDNIDYTGTYSTMKKIANLYGVTLLTDEEIEQMNMNLYNQIIYTVKCIQVEIRKMKKKISIKDFEEFEQQFHDIMFVAFAKNCVEDMRNANVGADDATILKLLEQQEEDFQKKNKKKNIPKKKNT